MGNSSSGQADYDSGRDLALKGTLERILAFLLRWLLSGSGQMLQLQIHDFSGLAFVCRIVLERLFTKFTKSGVAIASNRKSAF